MRLGNIKENFQMFLINLSMIFIPKQLNSAIGGKLMEQVKADLCFLFVRKIQKKIRKST